jgi:type IV pilus assembly protein PilC
MRKFSYEARDQASNKITKATVQADSENAAAKLLLAQGLTPLNIKEQTEGNGLLAKITGRITTKDKIVFTRQLATLIGAGLPLSQSMKTILDQTQNKKMQSIVQEISVSIDAGKTLLESFSKYPDVFDVVFLALVGAGEVSGTLDQSLQRVANQQEKDAAMMSKIKGALTYPVIVLFVIFGVLAFMLLTVVPQVEKLYKDLRQTLPALTQAMVNAANFLVNYWWIAIIAVVITIYLTIQYFHTDSGKKMSDLIKLKVPLFGPLFQKLYTARFMRTGQTLLSTGVSMLDMLRITGEGVNNSIVQKSISQAAEVVKGGKALSDALQPQPFIPSLVPQMIKIGEQSGRIDEMMGKTAQVYEDELDNQVRTISTLIEPVLMVVLAVVAGGMVAAILFPIYSLINGIKM